MKESKDARKERQAKELWTFIDVLRRAGNAVEEEVLFDVRLPDSSQEPSIPRKWRFDVVLPCCPVARIRQSTAFPVCDNIAIEIEGLGGRHQSMKGFRADIEKYAEAFAQSWVVLRVTRKMIADGSALDYLARRGVRVEAAPATLRIEATNAKQD